VPTYQYACKESACGHRFEAVQSFSDDPIAVCPVCEGNVRKVFSAVGVVFKGSGFYRNDSREPAKSSSSNGTTAKDGGTGTESGSGSGASEKKAESTSSSTSSTAGSGSSGTGSASSSSGSTSTAAAS
jgi:putative FmdB family regulatory protein